ARSRMAGARAIFAGVFDVHRNSGKILDHDLAGQAGVAAGAARCDNQSSATAERPVHELKLGGENPAPLRASVNGLPERTWLLVNLTEDEVWKRALVAGHAWLLFLVILQDRDLMGTASRSDFARGRESGGRSIFESSWNRRVLYFLLLCQG